MSAFFTIELTGLRFFAEHGMYHEEAKVGNQFLVDVSIVCAAPESVVHSVDQTINYAEAYEILQEEFGTRKQLLETSAMTIAARLEKRFPQMRKLVISIKKLTPPITNFTGAVGVTYTREFK
jgi:7,8-dihydroneopterin aldolase/epimerase/oxygenase